MKTLSDSNDTAFGQIDDGIGKQDQTNDHNIMNRLGILLYFFDRSGPECDV